MPPNPGYKGPSPNTVISSKPPVPNVDFPNHVEQLHANGNVGFNRYFSENCFLFSLKKGFRNFNDELDDKSCDQMILMINDTMGSVMSL